MVVAAGAAEPAPVAGVALMSWRVRRCRRHRAEDSRVGSTAWGGQGDALLVVRTKFKHKNT
jgi:hypothetical protein